MKTTCLVLSICTLAMGLALQSAAWGYTVDASTQWRYGIGPNGYTQEIDGTPTAAGIIVPGATGVGSSLGYSYGPANGFSLSVSAGLVQDYGIFYGQASSQLTRANPTGDFEYLQAFATGTFKQTLTIPGPIGTTGTLMLGWDVTGSSSSSTTGDAHLIIFALTSASLPNTYSQTTGIKSNGHYNLFSPISFTFGTPFVLEIDSNVFAAVGYDYTSTTGPTVFSDTASADFLHTATLSSVVVSDSAGNPLANPTIITDSGLPFLPVGAPVPVPSTLLLLGPALGGLVAMRRRFKK